MAAPLWALPDPRDSVIVETKTVNPGAGSPATYVKIFITNKDSLAAFVFPLAERSTSGGAYLVLSRPRNYSGVIHSLTTTLQFYPTFVEDRYNEISPDTFLMAGFWGPLNKPETAEPPNLSRKAFLEIKFDTIRSNIGTVEFDSVRLFYNSAAFVNSSKQELKVNFKKGIITVAEPPPPPCKVVIRLDVNEDGTLTTADVVQALNCAFFDPSMCRVELAPSDVIILMTWVFGGVLVPPGC